MAQKRSTPEEIIGKLRHADVLLGQGKKLAEIVKALGITDVTYYLSSANTPSAVHSMLIDSPVWR